MADVINALLTATQGLQQHVEALQASSESQMKAVTALGASITALLDADRMRNADINQIKADIALIKETLRAGSRH